METPSETQARLLDRVDGKEAWRSLCARVGVVRAEFAERHCGGGKLSKEQKAWTWQACVAEMDGGPAVDVASWAPPEPEPAAEPEAAVDHAIDAELPERALADDVAWAYEQLPDFQAAAKEKSERKMEAILKRAPSGGARSWLIFAASNPSKFMGDVVPKIVGKREEAEQASAGDPAVFRDDQRKQFAMLDLLEGEDERVKG